MHKPWTPEETARFLTTYDNELQSLKDGVARLARENEELRAKLQAQHQATWAMAMEAAAGKCETPVTRWSDKASDYQPFVLNNTGCAVAIRALPCPPLETKRNKRRMMLTDTKVMEVAVKAVGASLYRKSSDKVIYVAKLIQTAIDETTADLRAQLAERDAQLAAEREASAKMRVFINELIDDLFDGGVPDGFAMQDMLEHAGFIESEEATEENRDEWDHTETELGDNFFRRILTRQPTQDKAE